MALIRWRPSTEVWDPFANLTEIQEEMNRLFDTSLRRHGAIEGAFIPALDVVEEKDSILVKADLPGLTKDDISVAIQDNVLTIKGERKYDVEKKEANYYRRERAHGLFTRSIELPVGVDSGKVSATFRDGVLHVTLPKAESAKPKEIKVSVS
jgi:HSP20 family protein